MAEINILTASSIKGKTAFVRQTSELKLVLENPVGSGKVFKINSLSKFPPQINSGGSSNFFIVNAEFPINARFKYDQQIQTSGNTWVNRWTVINKNEMLYLPEGTAIWSNDNGAGANQPVDITISYEEIS